MKEIENEKIFDLLASKSYDELNESERILILNELSESEYKEFRSLIVDFKDVDKTIEIKKPKEKYKRKTNWWNYKIPSYQVAAVLVITVVSTFLLTKNNIENSSFTENNYAVLDTITNLSNSVNIDKEEYPTNLVINW